MMSACARVRHSSPDSAISRPGSVMDTVALFAGMIGLSPREGAARFAAAGVPIFPCKPAEKRPLTEHGFRDATSDDRQIARWWSRWPEANIGMPTGRASAVEVVDIDVHGRVRGFAAFELARREGLVDRWQALVKTASGGMHAYYPADPDRVQASWQAASAGIDFRGEGGYVIVPPSLVLFEGNRSAYELIGAGRGDAVSIDGSALRQFLDPRPTPTATMPAEARRDVDAERIAAWLAARAEGERNRALYWAACRLAENGITDQSARNVLGPAAEHAGLHQAEILTTIRSAYRTVVGQYATLSHQWWQLSIPLAQRAGDLVIPATTDPRSGRIAVWTAVVGTVFIAVGAFWLSFTALADLAHASGIAATQAWAWPLIVDGIIVVGTVAVVALAGQRGAWYPWMLLMIGAAVSVAANSIHAVVAADADVLPVLAASVAAVPPLVLLAITHLTVVLTQRFRLHVSSTAETSRDLSTEVVPTSLAGRGSGEGCP